MLPFSTRTLFLFSLSLLLTMFLFPPTLSAQFDTASVLGTIRDESGAVLAGAAVTLTNQETGISSAKETERKREL